MRTFVAAEITDAVLVDSIKKFQDETHINARPINPANLHFTLQFLGDISEDTTKKVARALWGIKFSGFAVTLRGIGAYPSLKSPRVIWVGTDQKGGEMLAVLSEKVRDALKPLGLQADEGFSPHITIFRIKKNIDISELEIHKMKSFGVQEIQSIKLKESRLMQDGSVYLDIEEIGAR